MDLDQGTLQVVLIGLVSLIILLQLFRDGQLDQTRLVRLEQKIDAILQSLDINLPAPWDVMGDDWKAIALQPDRKIEAIKLLRERTGLGLAASKSAVEEFQRATGNPNV